MINKMTIENMRCFKQLTLENISPLTLIAGKNSVGKSALLEAVFLFLSIRLSDIFYRILQYRGNQFPSAVFSTPQEMTNPDPPPWEQLFTDFDMTKELCIAMEEETGEAHILKLSEKEENISTPRIPTYGNSQIVLPPYSGGYRKLEISYSHNGSISKSYHEYTPPNSNIPSYQVRAPEQQLPRWPATFYYRSYFTLTSLPDWFGKIDLEGKKDDLVKYINILDDSIQDLFIVPSRSLGQIYARRRLQKSLPLRAMGDGINNLLNFLLIMIANPGCVLLIDEIENGFHHSFHETLWKVLSTVAKNNNCQVFATTHSYECIAGAADGVIDKSMLSMVRLGIKRGEIFPYHSSGDELAFALEQEMEVR